MKARRDKRANIPRCRRYRQAAILKPKARSSAVLEAEGRKTRVPRCRGTGASGEPEAKATQMSRRLSPRQHQCAQLFRGAEVIESLKAFAERPPEGVLHPRSRRHPVVPGGIAELAKDAGLVRTVPNDRRGCNVIDLPESDVVALVIAAACSRRSKPSCGCDRHLVRAAAVVVADCSSWCRCPGNCSSCCSGAGLVAIFTWRRFRPQDYVRMTAAVEPAQRAVRGAGVTPCRRHPYGSGKIRVADSVWLVQGTMRRRVRACVSLRRTARY